MSECEPLSSKIYKLLYYNILSFSAITLCACCFGVLVMALLIGLYYTCLFPTLPTASLEAPGMYDYANDYQDLRVKKDLTHQDEEENLSDYYETSSDNDLYRPKRNETTSSSSEVTTLTSVDKTQPTDTAGPETTSSGRRISEDHGENTTGTTAATTPDEEVDFGISSKFIDSVFNYAAQAQMKDPLGLCRNNVNIKIPQFNVTLFPAEDSDEILTCLNDVLKNMTSGNLCIQLDPELDAYLRWLVLTGEPKRMPPKRPTNDDILFPSLCEDGHKHGPKHNISAITMNSTNSTC